MSCAKTGNSFRIVKRKVIFPFISRLFLCRFFIHCESDEEHIPWVGLSSPLKHTILYILAIWAGFAFHTFLSSYAFSDNLHNSSHDIYWPFITLVSSLSSCCVAIWPFWRYTSESGRKSRATQQQRKNTTVPMPMNEGKRTSDDDDEWILRTHDDLY